MLQVSRCGIFSPRRIVLDGLRRSMFRGDTLCVVDGMNYRSLYQLALLV